LTGLFASYVGTYVAIGADEHSHECGYDVINGNLIETFDFIVAQSRIPKNQNFRKNRRIISDMYVQLNMFRRQYRVILTLISVFFVDKILKP